jgi:hypothetical protein
MFKNILIAIAIVIAGPAFVLAQDIFWSFSPTTVTGTSFPDFGSSASAYIFSDGLFGFDAIDLDFKTSDANVIRFTGGEAFNPTFSDIGRKRFNVSELTVDASGDSGGVFSINISENGVNPALGPLFDPGFVSEIGPYGAVLLARVDFDVIGFGTADLEFTLGTQGAVELPTNFLNPSFGSATVAAVPPKLGYCLGDVNLSGDPDNNFVDSVDYFDIPPFIAILSTGGYQFEADIDQNGVVNFLDISPFIAILSGHSH